MRALALVSVLTATACSPIVRNHGYAPAATELANVQVGRDTREDVSDKVGTPLNTGMGREDAWYYVETEMHTYGLFKPRAARREIVAIRFDQAGAVENIETFDLADGQVVRLTARVTDSAVSELGILRQIFGNVGAPSAADVLGDAPGSDP